MGPSFAIVRELTLLVQPNSLFTINHICGQVDPLGTQISIADEIAWSCRGKHSIAYVQRGTLGEHQLHPALTVPYGPFAGDCGQFTHLLGRGTF